MVWFIAGKGYWLNLPREEAHRSESRKCINYGASGVLSPWRHEQCYLPNVDLWQCTEHMAKQEAHTSLESLLGLHDVGMFHCPRGISQSSASQEMELTLHDPNLQPNSHCWKAQGPHPKSHCYHLVGQRSQTNKATLIRHEIPKA